MVYAVATCAGKPGMGVHFTGMRVRVARTTGGVDLRSGFIAERTYSACIRRRRYVCLTVTVTRRALGVGPFRQLAAGECPAMSLSGESLAGLGMTGGTRYCFLQREDLGTSQ